MNNDALYQKLRETGWRRPLTGAEEAQLRQLLESNPELQASWEGDSGLNELLYRLPDAPVPSNFTARVLQEVAREEARGTRDAEPAAHHTPAWRRWIPRFALGGSAAAVALALTLHVQSERAQRAEMAQSLAAVADVSSLPSPEILKDFEVVRALSRAPAADEELLALFQ